MITENISTLVNYGIAAGLLEEADRIYTVNTLLELFGLDDYEEPENPQKITNPADFWDKCLNMQQRKESLPMTVSCTVICLTRKS